MFRKVKNLKGQVLLEGLIALSLASIIIVAIVTAVTSSVSTTRVSGLKNQANQYAQEAVELSRTQRGLAEGFYCLGKGSAQLESPVEPETCTDPNIDNTFVRTVEIVEDGCTAGVNNVIVNVSWADATCDSGEFCQSVQLASCLDPSGGLIAGNFPTPTLDPNATATPVEATWTPTSPPISNTPVPTNTPIPTNTPVPTNTPIPTNTPVPTNTPIPTPTPQAGVYYKTMISDIARRTPSACGTSQGGVPTGTVGKYLEGPTSCNSYNRYRLQTSYYGTGWLAQSSGPWLAQESFPQTVTAIEGLEQWYTACSYTSNNCQRSTLIRANFDLRLSKIACQNCSARKWWIYTSSSSFGSGSLLGSGTSFTTVSPGWREVNLNPGINLNQGSYYRIVFAIDVPDATFYGAYLAPQRQYVDFLQARNDDSGWLANPGSYDIRVQITGL